MSNISEKQLAANRANALKSTGPTSEEGKSTVSENALKHGLSAANPASVLMPGEDADEFHNFGIRLRQALHPVGDMEELLVERIESCGWRLKRIERVEAGLFAYGFLERQAEQAQQEIKRQNDLPDVFSQAKGELANSMEHPEDTIEQEDTAAVKQAAAGVEASGFLQDAQNNNAFSKLSRYEAGLESSFYKALDELRKLQRNRRLSGSSTPSRRVVRS